MSACQLVRLSDKKLENKITIRSVWFLNSGHWSEVEPPFPISNREVKRLSADNSLSARNLENRSWPEFRNQTKPTCPAAAGHPPLKREEAFILVVYRFNKLKLFVYLGTYILLTQNSRSFYYLFICVYLKNKHE